MTLKTAIIFVYVAIVVSAVTAIFYAISPTYVAGIVLGLSIGFLTEGKF